MRIAYILGLKKGIHRFIYRELLEIEKEFEIFIFPTKLSQGIYNPKESWHTNNWSAKKVLLSQVSCLFRNPVKYISLLSEALSTGSLVDFLLAVNFSESMRKEGIDRIHCHFADHKLYVGYYCKKITELPLTVTVHAHELYRNPNWRMFSRALLSCDRIISISDFNKKELIEKHSIPEAKIEVIRLFVEPHKAAFRKPQEVKNILIVGSFEERKGYDVLLDALSRLGDRKFHLSIVGEGHLPVRRWVSEHRLDGKVRFCGTLPAEEVDLLYEECDFFVLPSKTVNVAKVAGSNITASGEDREGIPVALMEAMSFGKPVISTKHAGIPELVSRYLVDEDDCEELAEKIAYLLDHPGIYRELGAENIKIIRSKYSSKNIKGLVRIFSHEGINNN